MISVKEAVERKNRIKDAAYQLFRENGVENVTYPNISELSSISESSIYHYYPKKSYLLLDTYKYLWLEIENKLKQDTIDTESYQKANGFRQVECLVEAFENVYVKHSGYLRFALECKLYWNRQSVAIDCDEYDKIISPIISHFSMALKKGIEDQSVHLNADYESSCFLIWGILRSYIEQVVILDGFYKGENRYQKHFRTLKDILLISLQ